MKWRRGSKRSALCILLLAHCQANSLFGQVTDVKGEGFPFPAAEQKFAVPFEGASVTAHRAPGEGASQFLFAAHKCLNYTFKVDHKRCELTGTADQVLASRLPEGLKYTLEMNLCEYTAGTAKGSEFLAAASATDALKGKQILSPSVTAYKAKLRGYDRDGKGAWVDLSNQIILPTASNDHLLPTIAFHIRAKDVERFRGIKLADLQIELTTTYRARISNLVLVIHGSAASTVCSDIAKAAEQVSKGNPKKLVCFVGNDGKILEKDEIETLFTTNINQHIDVLAGADIDPTFVAKLAMDRFNALLMQAAQESERQSDIVVLRMPSGRIFEATIDVINHLTKDKLHEIEKQVAGSRSNSLSIGLENGSSIGVGLISGSSKLGFDFDKSDAEFKEEASRDVEHLRTIAEGQFHTLSGIQFEALTKLRDKRVFDDQLHMGEFTVGQCSFESPLSFRDAVENRTTVPPPPKEDKPEFRTGALIAHATGHIVFVHYVKGGVYIVVDGDKSMAVHPDAEGRFEAFGKQCRFMPDGSVTGLDWLSSQSERGFSFFDVVDGKGRRPGRRCKVSPDSEGGLSLEREDGDPATAVFFPNSQRFHVQKWGLDGEVLPDGRIQWPGGFWQH